jgi:chemosensory pili system protein ChpA (sensor histidine kinase/response regulator)
VVAVEAPIEVPEVATIAAAAESATEPEADALSAEALDEPVKVIGDLRIGIPLYNVYLAEADEWSRRLQTEMGEWAMQPDTPLPESIPSLAHGLAGSSATVGFTALSDLARSLENALLKVLPQNSALPEQVEAFTLAADDIRRLLHLFAAGFLKTPDPAAVQRLQALENLEIPAELLETPEPEAPIESDPSDPFDVPGFSMTAALAGAAITDKPLPSPSSDGVPAALLSAGPTPVFTPQAHASDRFPRESHGACSATQRLGRRRR